MDESKLPWDDLTGSIVFNAQMRAGGRWDLWLRWKGVNTTWSQDAESARAYDDLTAHELVDVLDAELERILGLTPPQS